MSDQRLQGVDTGIKGLALACIVLTDAGLFPFALQVGKTHEGIQMRFQRNHSAAQIGIILQNLRNISGTLARRNHLAIGSGILHVDVVDIRSDHIPRLQGVHAGVAFSITQPEILIGSDPSCQLLYPVNLTDIAPRHGKLVVKNGGLYLADLGTQSGITLNGTRLSPLTGYLLKSGDRFSLGSSGQDFYVI